MASDELPKKKSKTRRKITPKVEREILAAISEGQTMVYICSQLEITRMTEWSHRQSHPEYRLKLEAALERRIEMVEDSVYSKALSGDVTAQRFFLTNLSSHRWKNIQDHKVGGDEEGRPIKIGIREILVDIPVSSTEPSGAEEENPEGSN